MNIIRSKGIFVNLSLSEGYRLFVKPRLIFIVMFVMTDLVSFKQKNVIVFNLKI